MKITNTIKSIIIMMILVISCLTSYAQPNLTFYNSRSVAQGGLLNPALPSRQAFTFGFDYYSSLYVPGITAYDIFRNDEDSATTVSKILNDNKYNFKNVSLNNEINPIFIGFKAGKNYFSMGLQLKMNIGYGLPKDLFGLAVYGNAGPQYLGKKVDLSDIDFNANAYTAIHFGYSRDFTDKLTIGIRGKYLLGLFDAQLKVKSAYLLTDTTSIDNYFKTTTNADYTLQAAGIDRIKGIMDKENPLSNMGAADLINKYQSEPIGSGFAVDLGVNYKFTNRLSVSGSVIDLGYINWKEANPFTKNATFNFEGVSTNHIDSLEKEFERLLDSVGKIFEPEKNTTPYKSYLVPKVYLGMNYNFTNSSALGLLLYGEFFPGNFRPGASVSLSQRIWRILDLKVNYNIYGTQYSNIGLGFAMHMGPVVVFASSDNALGAYNWNKTHYTNVRVGLNINIGGRFDSDNDGVPNRKDKCKKVPGLIKFSGCPDIDGDSVPDHLDECVTIKGTVIAKGCPDADGDGVKDVLDSCVNEKGSMKLNGCPDKDHDGVADKYDLCPSDSGAVINKGCPDDDNDGVLNKNDECPKVFGSKITRGCPDMDKDSVADKNDECPGVPGPVRLKGCPDTDGDGIINKNDSCIGEAGPASTKGCPDTDNDGIPDKSDNCPTEAGTVESGGCPEIDPSLVQLSVEEKKVLSEAFSNLEFVSGTAKISDKSKESLAGLAELLTVKADYKLEISGHTDNVGKESANQKLSQNRANAVKNFLISKGINGTRILAKGFGSKVPVYLNDTPEGRQRNRRVEFKIVK
ncbi:MAG: DUF5723 family protein [Bacteroidota bacterium]|nr:DUF5723 family protein [Bacteroidota bacterium]